MGQAEVDEALRLLGSGGGGDVIPSLLEHANNAGARYQPPGYPSQGMKDTGFYGPLDVPAGPHGPAGWATEFGMPLNEEGGDLREVPSIVPGLTHAQLENLRTNVIPNGLQIPPDVARIAEAHARARIASGKSPFFDSKTEKQLPYPKPDLGPEASQAMQLLHSSNPDYGIDTAGLQRATELIRAGGLGALTGFAVSGFNPVGAVVGGAAGLAGEATRSAVTTQIAKGPAGRYAGLPEAAGTIAGGIVDLGVNAAGGIIAPASAAARTAEALRPSVRAGQMLERAGLLGEVGTEGAIDVARAVDTGYARLKGIADQKWAAYDAAPFAWTVSGNRLRTAATDLLTKMRGSDEPSHAAQKVFQTDFFNRPLVNDQVSVDDVQSILSAIAEDERAAALDPKVASRTGGLSGLKKAANDTLDDIENQATAMGGTPDQVQALREARKATAQLHEAVPTKSALYRTIVGRTAYDQPTRALAEILRGTQGVQEVQRVRALAQMQGPDTAATVDRGLRRVAISLYYGRASGASGDIAPRTAGAAATTGEQYSEVLKEILGPKGFNELQTWNRAIFGSVKNVRERMLPSIRARIGPLGSTDVGPGAVLGFALGYGASGTLQGASAGTAAGIAIPRIIHGIADRLGNNAARSIAIEALTSSDPTIMRTLVQRTKSAQVVTRAIESFARRGVLTYEDVTDQPTPRSNIRVEGQQAPVRVEGGTP